MAKFFRIAKLCESAGYGFDKMLEWKKQTGNNVFFETQIDKTKFTFMIDWKNDIKEETVEKNNIENNIENSIENNQKTTRKQPENLKDLILEIIKSNGKISRSEMVKQLNITEGSLRHHLEQLKNANIIRRDGADKGGKWIILSEHL